MSHCRCGPGASWCARTDELFGVEGIHVLAVASRDDGTVVLDVETDQMLAGCPDCGVVAVGHGRRVQVVHDAPCFGRPNPGPDGLDRRTDSRGRRCEPGGV